MKAGTAPPWPPVRTTGADSIISSLVGGPVVGMIFTYFDFDFFGLFLNRIFFFILTHFCLGLTFMLGGFLKGLRFLSFRDPIFIFLFLLYKCLCHTPGSLFNKRVSRSSRGFTPTCTVSQGKSKVLTI